MTTTTPMTMTHRSRLPRSIKSTPSTRAVLVGSVFGPLTTGFSDRVFFDTNVAVAREQGVGGTQAYHLQPEAGAVPPEMLVGEGNRNGAALSSAYGLRAVYTNCTMVRAAVRQVVQGAQHVFAFFSKGGGTGSGGGPLVLEMLREEMAPGTVRIVVHALYGERGAKVCMDLADCVRHFRKDQREVHLLARSPERAVQFADLTVEEVEALLGAYVNLDATYQEPGVNFDFLQVVSQEYDPTALVAAQAQAARARVADRMETGSRRDAAAWEDRLPGALQTLFETVRSGRRLPEAVLRRALALPTAQADESLRAWCLVAADETDLDGLLAEVGRALYQLGLGRGTGYLDKTVETLSALMDRIEANLDTGSPDRKRLQAELEGYRTARTSLKLKELFGRAETGAASNVRATAEQMVRHELARRAADALERMRARTSEIRAEVNGLAPNGHTTNGQTNGPALHGQVRVVERLEDGLAQALAAERNPFNEGALDDALASASEAALADPIPLLCDAVMRDREGPLAEDFAPSQPVQKTARGVVVASPFPGAAQAVARVLGVRPDHAVEVRTHGLVRVTVFSRLQRLADSDAFLGFVRSAERSARESEAFLRARTLADLPVHTARDGETDDDGAAYALLLAALVPHALRTEDGALTVELYSGRRRFASLAEVRAQLTFRDEVLLSDAFFNGTYAADPIGTERRLEQLAKGGREHERFMRLASVTGQVRLEQASQTLAERIAELKPLLEQHPTL